MKRPALSVGDVFTIQIDAGRRGIGQIVEKFGRNAYYLAVFDSAWPIDVPIDLDQAIRSRVMFLALSLDAKFHVGDWTVIGNRPSDLNRLLPAFRELSVTPEGTKIVDYSGRQQRPATVEESTRVPFRKIVAPVRLEKGLRARFGLLPWIEEYSELAPDPINTTVQLFK